MKRIVSLLCLVAVSLTLLTSCDVVLDAIKEGLASEFSFLNTGNSQTGLSGSGDTDFLPSSGQSDSVIETGSAETPSSPSQDPSESSFTTQPSTPSETTQPTPTTPSTTPTPEEQIPFRTEPEIPPYSLPAETFTDPLEREASQIIDAAIEKAIAAILVLRDDRHSSVSYAYEEDSTGYTKDLNENQKKLYRQLISYAENFAHFKIEQGEYEGDLISDALTVAKPLMLCHPDLNCYFGFLPGGMLDSIRDKYSDPAKDGNYTVENGDVTMEEIKRDMSLLSHIVKRIVRKMPDGLTTYDRYCYLAFVLCAHVTYDGTAENCFTPYGALVGGRCVCEGYSRAFLLLCREANLWCGYRAGSPKGGGHIWNMVKLESGIYNLDVTWCDACEIGAKKWYARFIKSDADFEKDGHNAKEGVKGTGSFEPNPYQNA